MWYDKRRNDIRFSTFGCMTTDNDGWEGYNSYIGGENKISDVFYTKLRSMVGLQGLLSLIFGLLIVFWPNRTAAAVTVMVGIAFIAIGAAYVAAIGTHDDESAWARLGSFLVGVIYLVAGVFSFINLYAATAYLFLIVGLWVGITWIVEAIVTFASLKYFERKGWAAFSALISLLAGVVLLFSPLIGAAILWLLLGLAMIVVGVVKIFQYFTWSHRHA